MSNHSLETLLEWMSGQNRTLGWDAVMALDRGKTNMLLTQEYINHFRGDSYLPPVTASIETSETITQYVYGFTLGVPLLTFTNANLEDSKAALSMDVVGGSHVTVEQLSAHIRRVRRFSEVVPLAGPKLTLDLNLLAVPGSVNRAGQVVLDLKDSSNFKLDFVDNATEQALGGDYFERLFERLPDDKRVFVLGELARDTGGTIVPESFSLRTQPAPGAKAKGAANYGDGAVLVFITMPGGRPGAFPANGSGWKYLIPAAQGGVDYSGTLLLSNRAVYEKSINAALGKTPLRDAAFEPIVENGEVRGLKGVSGFYRLGGNITYSEGNRYLLYQPHNFSVYDVDSEGAKASAFTFTQEAGVISTSWSASHFRGNVWLYLDNHQVDSVQVYLGLSHSARFRYVLKADKVVLEKLEEANYEFSFRSDPFPIGFTHLWPGFVSGANSQLDEMMRSHWEDFELPGELDTFLLSSLLFRGNNSLHIRDVRHPHDLALFGEVDPSQTTFAITPLRPIIGHGSSQPFTTVPSRSGLRWSVHTVPGDDSAPGTIDAQGRYQAPAASAIKGPFTRVIVTATDQANGTSSSAMVTVMVRDIAIDPLIQICGPRQHRELSAGALGEDTLRWRLVGDTGGATLLPSTENDGDYTFTAGSQAPDGTGFFLNTIEVESVTTGKTQQAHVLVLHGDHTLSVEIDKQASLPAGQFKMVAKRNGTVRPTARFALTAGSGAITPEGIYTVDPNGQHRFALITAVYELRDEDYVERFEGYNIFPLPLEEFSSIWPDRTLSGKRHHHVK